MVIKIFKLTGWADYDELLLKIQKYWPGVGWRDWDYVLLDKGPRYYGKMVKVEPKTTYRLLIKQVAEDEGEVTINARGQGWVNF